MSFSAFNIELECICSFGVDTAECHSNRNQPYDLKPWRSIRDFAQ